MPIEDLGYRRWAGRRTNPLLRWLVLARSGIALAYRSRLVQRVLWLSWVPVLYMGVIFFLMARATEGPGDLSGEGAAMVRVILGREAFREFLRDPVSLRQKVWSVAFYHFSSYLQLWTALALAGLVGAGLLSRDIKGKTFLMYYSKPLTLAEYFLGKASVIAFYVALVTLLPNLALYCVSVAFSPSLDVLLHTWRIPVAVVAAYVCVVVPTTLLVLFFSSLTAEERYAMFGWFALILFGAVAAALVSLQIQAAAQRGVDWPALLSLKSMLDLAIWKIFGSPEIIDAGDLGVLTARPATASAIVLACLSAAALAVIVRRLSAPVRI